nr:MAG TPA: hypothetical protein [Caudoviricetes sp.]
MLIHTMIILFCVHKSPDSSQFVYTRGVICVHFVYTGGLVLALLYQRRGNLYPKSTIIWEPMQGGVGGITVRTICIMRCLTPVSPVYI